MTNVPYVNDIGSIMYVMVCTRLDIAYGVSLLNHYMSNTGKDPWEALKWILRYLKGNVNFGLIYQRKRIIIGLVEGYVDSDYANDLDRRISITSYLFTVCGCTVSWKSTSQNIVTLSTIKAEYVAIVEATKEAL